MFDVSPIAKELLMNNVPLSDGRIEAFTEWKIVKQLPEPGTAVPLEYAPDRVNKYWVSARQAEMNKDWVNAETSAVKTFEVLLQAVENDLNLFPDGGYRGPYKKRLRKILEQADFPNAMHEWLDNIKELRNEATHGDDDPTHDKITEAISFVEVFVTYYYTLPGRIESRKVDSSVESE